MPSRSPSAAPRTPTNPEPSEHFRVQMMASMRCRSQFGKGRGASSCGPGGSGPGPGPGRRRTPRCPAWTLAWGGSAARDGIPALGDDEGGRLWAGWFTAARNAGTRPLLVVLDCKGDRDARRKADRTRHLLYARRRPPGCALARPGPEQPVGSATGAAGGPAVPDDRDRRRRRLLRRYHSGRPVPDHHRPGGPPPSAAASLGRLDPAWLQRAWDDGRHPASG
jgi:hypothetical protein